MSSLLLRPTTLAALSRRVLAGQQDFDPGMREYLDEFYAHPSRRQESLKEEPELIEDIKDAYLAATAEHLSTSYELELPRWVEGHGQRLKRAFFAGGLESLKAILTVESPAAFRRRLLFVSHNALDRPRKYAEPEACELSPSPKR